jgi:hypothetical protein
MITDVPLSPFDLEIRRVNITVHGGRLASDGLLEYSPRVTRVEVNKATIADVGIGYLHSPAKQKQEAQRVKETGEQIQRQNNRPAVELPSASSTSTKAISRTAIKPVIRTTSSSSTTPI